MGAIGFNTRRHKRKTFDAVACITASDGSAPIRCEIADISDGGARLRVARPETVPNLFVLWLSTNGSVRRKCRAQWRSRDELGAKFL